MVGVDLVELDELWRAELVCRDLAVMVRIELLKCILRIGKRHRVDREAGVEFDDAQDAIMIGVELGEEIGAALDCLRFEDLRLLGLRGDDLVKRDRPVMIGIERPKIIDRPPSSGPP